MLIKICGMRDAALATEAIKLGAQMIGLMFYEKSKRHVDVLTAKPIAHAVKQAGGEPVAVFVEQTAEDMLAICRETGITTVQLHGELPRKQHSLLPEHFKRIYVVSVNDEENLVNQPDITHQLDADRDLLLFDNRQGGSGQPFCWDKFTNPYPLRYLLAGGLRSDNVREAITQLKPYGVDVSSGVERMPGVKDLPLIKDFIAKLRNNND